MPSPLQDRVAVRSAVLQGQKVVWTDASLTQYRAECPFGEFSGMAWHGSAGTRDRISPDLVTALSLTVEHETCASQLSDYFVRGES